MRTIITEFGKFRYNSLPMVMCASGDIFQAKLDKLHGDIEGIKTYINGIIVLRKQLLYKSCKKMSIIFGRLRAAGLKLNAPRSSFGLKDIPCICYIITRAE